MKITVVGKGNVGGGLASLWEKAGHEVQRLGSEGGDASGADAVLIAIPGAAVPGVFESVAGLAGRVVIDATNLIGADAPGGFASNAEFIKSRLESPDTAVAKSFNLNFAAIYDKIGATSATPGNVWCGEDAARAVVEQLSRDAGYDPIYAGGLEQAGVMESALRFLFAIAQGGMGPFFYRMAPPDQF